MAIISSNGLSLRRDGRVGMPAYLQTVYLFAHDADKHAAERSKP